MYRAFTILHMSDIHRTDDEPVSNNNILEALTADLRRQQRDEGLPKPDFLVISGDLTQSASEDEYHEAFDLISQLKNELTVPDFNRVILVPGNHDINWSNSENVFSTGRNKPPNVYDYALVHEDNQIFFWTDEERYSQRLKPFREFYSKVYGREYGKNRREQFDIWSYPNFNICFVGLNSSDRIDHLRFRGIINEETFHLANRRLKDIPNDHCLKIAVWHHDLNWLGGNKHSDGLEPSILGHLVSSEYDLALCGHTHRTNFNEYKYPGFRLPIIAAGSICAGPRQREESIPRLYNLIHIEGNVAKVYTRSRETKDTPWRPYANWGTPARAYFDVHIEEIRDTSTPFKVETTVSTVDEGIDVAYSIKSREHVNQKRKEIRTSKYGNPIRIANAEDDILGLYALRNIFEHGMDDIQLPNLLKAYFNTWGKLWECKENVIRFAEELGWFDEKGNFKETVWAIAFAADHLLRRFEENRSDGEILFQELLEISDQMNEEGRRMLMMVREWWDPAVSMEKKWEIAVWEEDTKRLSLNKKKKRLRQLAYLERMRKNLSHSSRNISDTRHPIQWALIHGLEYELPNVFTILNEHRSEVLEECWEKLSGDAKTALTVHALGLLKKGLLEIGCEGKFIKILRLSYGKISPESLKELENDPISILHWLDLVPKHIIQNHKEWLQKISADAPRSEVWGRVVRKISKAFKAG